MANLPNPHGQYKKFTDDGRTAMCCLSVCDMLKTCVCPQAHTRTGCQFFQLQSTLVAIGQPVIYRCVKCIAQLSHRFGMKADNVLHLEYTANKNVVPSVKLNPGNVALVIHAVHGCTPARCKNSRASST